MPAGSFAASAKLAALRQALRGLPSALVCFSGGADSALVLKLARDELGDRVVALTAVSASLPEAEREAASAFCRSLGVPHLLADSRELEDPRYAANPADRCYYCKDELYRIAEARARELGLAAVLDGFNQDDASEHRPGRRAAVDRKVRSPLAEAGLTKGDVRAISKELDLPTWDKPAHPCLASRIPTGTPVTARRLAQIAAAEEAMRALGFRVFRVRHHDDVARIEVAAEEMSRFADPELRRGIDRRIREAGFRFVAVDLEPFRSGRLSEILPS
ncbi:MAG: ATP-dependent sacrificial sulfur transferase LarE [Myxococcales bacterium]